MDSQQGAPQQGKPVLTAVQIALFEAAESCLVLKTTDQFKYGGLSTVPSKTLFHRLIAERASGASA